MATDIDATKYRSEDVQDSFGCYMECRNNAECEYWSYVEPTYSGGSHRTCFLKSKKDWTDSDPAKKGITSGAKTKICPGSAMNSRENLNSVPNYRINSFFIV